MIERAYQNNSNIITIANVSARTVTKKRFGERREATHQERTIVSYIITTWTRASLKDVKTKRRKTVIR